MPGIGTVSVAIGLLVLAARYTRCDIISANAISPPTVAAIVAPICCTRTVYNDQRSSKYTVSQKVRTLSSHITSTDFCNIWQIYIVTGNLQQEMYCINYIIGGSCACLCVCLSDPSSSFCRAWTRTLIPLFHSMATTVAS